MVLFNHSTRELTAKIVYYGPGLCGKTTNLRVLHDRLEKGTAGRLLSLATAQDRTIYFDLLPVELGNIKGYTVRFQLCTVPGQVFYNETRKLVLRGVDGVVFVVDSQWSMVSHNLESWQNLVENLRDLSVGIESLPVVIQYNKRDLPGVLSIDALQESLGFPSYPFVEAVANAGQGVVETFKLVSKLTFVDLLRRLQRTGGIESDVFSVPTGAAAAAAAANSEPAASPGDDTFTRGGPPARRSTFSSAVSSDPPEPAPAPEMPAALGETLSPFDAGPGWIPASDADVFAVPGPEPVPAASAAPAPQSVATEADVLEMPEAPPAPEPAASVVAPPAEAASAPAPAPAPAPAAPDPALREAIERHEAALAQVRGELAGLREALERQDAAAAGLRGDIAAIRDAVNTLRAELGASIEGLASSTDERLSSVGADLFAAREEAGRVRAEHDEAQRLVGERLEAAERRTRTLAESIRRALDDLKD